MPNLTLILRMLMGIAQLLRLYHGAITDRVGCIDGQRAFDHSAACEYEFEKEDGAHVSRVI
jgi:hypothetical protein